MVAKRTLPIRTRKRSGELSSRQLDCRGFEQDRMAQTLDGED